MDLHRSSVDEHNYSFQHRCDGMFGGVTNSEERIVFCLQHLWERKLEVKEITSHTCLWLSSHFSLQSPLVYTLFTSYRQGQDRMQDELDMGKTPHPRNPTTWRHSFTLHFETFCSWLQL